MEDGDTEQEEKRKKEEGKKKINVGDGSRKANKKTYETKE